MDENPWKSLDFYRISRKIVQLSAFLFELFAEKSLRPPELQTLMTVELWGASGKHRWLPRGASGNSLLWKIIIFQGLNISNQLFLWECYAIFASYVSLTLCQRVRLQYILHAWKIVCWFDPISATSKTQFVPNRCQCLQCGAPKG